MKNFFKINLIIIALFLASCGGTSTSLRVDAEKSTSDEAYGADMVSAKESHKSESDLREESPVDSEEVPADVENPEIHNNRNSAGLLTAGEWNDSENWFFWQKLINDKQWSQMQHSWSFYLKDKISVLVKNQNGKALNNIKIVLEDVQGAKVWEAKTDIFGKANLFSEIYGSRANKLTLKAISETGEEIKLDNIVLNKENNITINQEQANLTDLDIMFVVDATGSMSDEINFLKTDLNDIIGKIKTKTPELTPRVGMVFYRDKSDDYIVKDFDFETNMSNIIGNLEQQSAGGGGDFPEAVEKGLEYAVKDKSWSNNAKTRLMFLILDAPPHKNKEDIVSIQISIKKAAELGIKVIPIVASGIDKDTEFLMRFMSVSTNGTYVFLTDDSGIGNSHIEPTVGKYEVEFLNNLIIRLIMKYTGTDPS